MWGISGNDEAKEQNQVAHIEDSSIRSVRHFQRGLVVVGVVTIAFGGVLSACGINSANSSSPASSYPTKPINLIVPYPAGSNPDVHARALATVLSKQLGQPINVIDQPGGSGEIGTSNVIRALPNGYTIGFESAPVLVINPQVTKGVIKGPSSITPIARIDASPLILFASSTSGITSVADLVKSAQAQPGKIKVAVGFSTDTFSMATERIESKANVSFNVVPVGTGNQILSVLNGTASVGWITPSLALPYIKSGKIRPLAVVAPKALAGINAPTLPSIGYNVTVSNTADFEFLFAPPKTPGSIVAKLATAAKRATSQTSYVSFMTKSDNIILYLGPGAFKTDLKSLFTELTPIVKKLSKKLS
jgi:tripartite-type tricarboxylate transporter receptor subunit TctC